MLNQQQQHIRFFVSLQLLSYPLDQVAELRIRSLVI